MYLFESHVTYISIKLFMFGMYVWFAGRSWVFFFQCFISAVSVLRRNPSF